MLTEDHGKLILRLMVGVLMLFHGIDKVTGGIEGIVTRFEGLGMGPVAYLVYVGEVLAPLLVIAGHWTRLGAFLIAGNMVVAILVAHVGDLWALTPNGGYRLELQMFFLFSAVAVMVFGAGRFSVGGRGGKWN